MTAAVDRVLPAGPATAAGRSSVRRYAGGATPSWEAA
jgi:hypothetical protein